MFLSGTMTATARCRVGEMQQEWLLHRSSPSIRAVCAPQRCYCRNGKIKGLFRKGRGLGTCLRLTAGCPPGAGGLTCLAGGCTPSTGLVCTGAHGWSEADGLAVAKQDEIPPAL